MLLLSIYAYTHYIYTVFSFPSIYIKRNNNPFKLDIVYKPRNYTVSTQYTLLMYINVYYSKKKKNVSRAASHFRDDILPLCINADLKLCSVHWLSNTSLSSPSFPRSVSPACRSNTTELKCAHRNKRIG